MLKSALKWFSSSLLGYFAASFLLIALPMFSLGMYTNIEAGYPTADLFWLIVLPILVAVPPPLYFWNRRRDRLRSKIR
jgi:hypothetical protein